jgi:chromosome segregation ATPase
MIDFLEYFSPLAILIFIWGIYQYFDKKKIEKTESRRAERIKYFDKLQSKLNELRYVLIEPHSEITKSTRILNTKLIGYESDTNTKIETLEEINKKIENLKISSLEKKELIKEQNQIIDYLSKKHIESTKFLEKEIQSVQNNLKPLSNRIETKTTELNEIPILGMSNITSGILTLTLKLKEIVNIIKTNETHTSKGVLSEEFTDSILKATEIIYRIEAIINIEIK